MTNTAHPVFASKAALIFGGAKGIGKAVALEWAARGARVAIADIDAQAAESAAVTIKASGHEAISLVADVTCEASIAAAGAKAEAAFGPIDILMNNVGAALNGHPEDIPFSEWQRITDLNYYGTVRAVGHFLPKMIARKSGHIVNTASFAGLYPYAASRIPYAASKAAVIALSQSLAIYLEPQGIAVSCFIPGPVMTEIANSMTVWTHDCPVRGPGAELDLLWPDAAARVLADGMEAHRILIPSDEKVWNTLERWARSPDDFIRSKIDEFARGDPGIPSFTPRS
ncbi:NAD(P)-dependent dehydrogenase (short-subunit alcohol dehydrogenase family) [Novosphingobium chloroacetimidivorans]|uniref:NAD(P)-dependent dehydrogenase (Short-subunit alcohol dehydrogenase family) n=1 Tax=Novosphingobium chloroacetimidivorans TaxID=1428314 RepID=A0A7W7KAC5_9SPHN|nr:SDR family oxidoreductase [Novosphingobium chloroacetimidivorans]MBB4858624.1 NAD(P)-dependent dehydrogenase (short-subunit alcohol dehydrogenase family) [Novosphingobium chloroacetimidivorans]